VSPRQHSVYHWKAVWLFSYLQQILISTEAFLDRPQDDASAYYAREALRALFSSALGQALGAFGARVLRAAFLGPPLPPLLWEPLLDSLKALALHYVVSPTALAALEAATSPQRVAAAARALRRNWRLHSGRPKDARHVKLDVQLLWACGSCQPPGAPGVATDASGAVGIIADAMTSFAALRLEGIYFVKSAYPSTGRPSFLIASGSRAISLRIRASIPSREAALSAYSRTRWPRYFCDEAAKERDAAFKNQVGIEAS
jgi:hypothetical protein